MDMTRRATAEFFGTLWLVFAGAVPPFSPPHFRDWGSDSSE